MGGLKKDFNDVFCLLMQKKKQKIALTRQLYFLGGGKIFSVIIASHSTSTRGQLSS